MIYLDHAATSPVLEDALRSAWPWLTAEFGNPSSTHELGFRADAALTAARESIAALVGARPSEVLFTSGGTEGNNFVIRGLALANPRGRHIVSARTEHESVLQAIEFLQRQHGFDVTWLPVDSEGRIAVADLRSALRPDTTLVSLMTINNETGVVHPILEFASVCAEFGVPLHTDAVQAPELVVNFDQSGVAAATVSGHKFGAPKGSGFVLLSQRLAVEPLLAGGGQEFGFRSGTENVAWAVAIASAFEALNQPSNTQYWQYWARLEAQNATFIDRVLAEVPGARLTGPREGRAAAIASFVFEGVSGERVLLGLEERGIICSSGSACAAGSDEPSHVLTAMGYPEDLARTAVRFSFAHVGDHAKFGATFEPFDLQRVVSALRQVVEQAKA